MVLEIKSVLVLDFVGAKGLEILTKHGIRVTEKVGLTESELIEEIPNYDALVVQSITKVTIDVLLAGKNLKVVASAGKHYSNIDIFAASNRKIGVINAPSGNLLGSCEFTCGLTIALAKQVVNSSPDHINDHTDPYRYIGSELNGKTLALVGQGEIARQISFRMKAFGMKVFGYVSSLTTKHCMQICGIETKLGNILSVADYVIICTGSFVGYRSNITTEVLAQCKRGVQIIIVGHIDVLEAQNIYEGLRSGQIAAAAFDLYEENVDEEFLKLPMFRLDSVITTFHNDAEIEAAVERGSQEAAEQLVNLCKPGTYDRPLSVVVRGNGM